MYDRELAYLYAKRWANGFNPNYYNFSGLGGDCTNFVSQCVHAGSVEMNFDRYGWYYLSLNNRAPAWSGVNEFWDFGTTNTGVGLKLTKCELSELSVGDIIQLFNGERYYHNLFVTSVDNKIRVSAHDNPAFNVPLENYYFRSFRCAKVGD